MIIEVLLDEETTPRRYQVQRRGSSFSVRRLADLLAADNDDHGGGVDRRAVPDGARETLIDWRRPERGIYSLLVDKGSFEVFIEENDDRLTVHTLNRTFLVRADDARRRRSVASAEVADGVARITAPIPGRVTKVLRSQGSEVKRGEGVIVLEAMKMENELRSPRDGIVTSVKVEEGQGVEGGTLMVTIE
ncbi:MAG: acetyl-CoA carboxylase biotin carboxyl carrier protein subunit [Acidobacteriota bacterium]